MTSPTDIPLSVLDLAPINQGATAADALHNSLDLAPHVEALGFNRYWVAEHHNIAGVASSATAVLIGQIAAVTKQMRVGSGGIMLPNHAPLVIAEQFGTLESLFPGRIDLGLGRAPGTDQMTTRALRRTLVGSDEQFPQMVDELRGYFEARDEHHAVRAIPGEGLRVPIWLLGSSDFSARLAAHLGLPFAFASQFAPASLMPALALYREHFQPSDVLSEPYAMVGVNTFVADTPDEAQRLASSHKQQFLNLIQGHKRPLAPPVENMDALWTPRERAMVEAQLAASFAGDPERVRKSLVTFAERTGANEIICSSAIHDHHARKRSYTLLAELWKNS